MKKKVLLADFDETHIKKITELLKAFDVEVDVVNTGVNAFEKLKEGGYELGIFSTILPEINGFDLTKKIRIELGLSKLPVALISSIYKGPRYRYEALHVYGADEFFEFPLAEEESLVAFFKKYLPLREEPAYTVRMDVLNLKEDTTVAKGEPTPAENEKNLVTTDELFGDLLKEVEDGLEEEGPEEVLGEKQEEEIIEEPEEIIEEVESENEEVFEEPELLQEPEEIVETGETVKGEEKGKVATVGKENKPREPEFKPEEILEEVFSTKPEKPRKKGKVEDNLIDKILEETLSGMEKPKGKPTREEKLKEAEKILQEELKQEEKVEKGKKEKTIKKEPEKLSVEEEPFGPLEEENILGEYVLLEKISTGGMAEIYKAKKKGVEGFEKVIALKKILPHLAEDEEFIKMFIDEAKLASRLNHPNIAQIYDLGKIDGSYFIAMEYVLGKDLKTILSKMKKEKSGLLPLNISSYIVMKIAEALDYAHRKVGEDGKPLNIVHRDVSPQNILISYEGEIKLVDFGVAKASIRAHQTVTGSLKGKLLYMSPEQARGKNVDRRSDIFSLGTVYYELVTGMKAFLGGSEAEILDKVRKGDFVPPRQIKPELPEEVEKIILKAMEIEPAKRYQNASEMRNDIEKFLLSHYGALPNARDVAIFMYSLFMDEIKESGVEVEIIKEKLKEPVIVEEVKEKKEEKKLEKAVEEKKFPEEAKEVRKEVTPHKFGFEVEKESEKSKKSSLGILVALALVIVLGAGVYYFLFFNRGKSITSPAEEKPVLEQTQQDTLPAGKEEYQLPSEEVPQSGEESQQPEAGTEAKSQGSVPAGVTTQPSPKQISSQKKTTPPVKLPSAQKTGAKRTAKVLQKQIPSSTPVRKKETQKQPSVEVQKTTTQTQVKPKEEKQPVQPKEVKPTPSVKTESSVKKAENISKQQPQKKGQQTAKPVIKEGSLVPYNLLDVKPKPLKKVAPIKPPLLKKSGLVTLMVLVSPEGRVEQVRVIRGLHPKYDEAARKAVLKWVFSSPIKEGKKVRTWTVITIKY